MGVVVPEGQITRGNILSKILGATATDEVLAWEAAGKTSDAGHISNMPMGMHAIVDPGNISGGKRSAFCSPVRPIASSSSMLVSQLRVARMTS